MSAEQPALFGTPPTVMAREDDKNHLFNVMGYLALGITDLLDYYED
ncbi:MAG: hypothetical protein WAS33_00360 [Candidatus Promineifilaceae bacterium]